MPAEHSLADQFYRLHGSRMKTRPTHQVWVVRTDALHACLCLQPIAHGHWLTSLFVDPALRGQGIAQQLLDNACASVAGPVWLFCHPDLQLLYAKRGFVVCRALPSPLADRLKRYQRTKLLIAMGTPG